jgi:regulator of RNase E activity RraA
MAVEAKIDISVLTRYSTPTVANAIELFEIRARDEGYLRPGLQCLLPEMAPVAGFASTCMVSSLRDKPRGAREPFDYWEHIDSLPEPRIAVVLDVDPQPGSGCFWGEVNSNIHQAVGCLGAVTNGAARDLTEMRQIGFQMLYGHTCVSHSYIHIVDFGKPLTFDGVLVNPGDLIQVDQHGALIVPVEVMPHLEEAIFEIERRERPVIDYCRSGNATRSGIGQAVSQHLRNLPRWQPVTKNDEHHS